VQPRRLFDRRRSHNGWLGGSRYRAALILVRSNNASVIPDHRKFNANEIMEDDGRLDEASSRPKPGRERPKLPIYGRRRVGPDAQAI
jgi:hypothetical protein